MEYSLNEIKTPRPCGRRIRKSETQRNTRKRDFEISRPRDRNTNFRDPEFSVRHSPPLKFYALPQYGEIANAARLRNSAHGMFWIYLVFLK